MDYIVNRTGNVAVFRLKRSLTRTNYGGLQEKISAELADGATAILFDMAEVSFIDSTGINILLTSKKYADAGKARFGVCALAENLADIITRLNLLSVIKVYSTFEKAMAALGS